MKKLIISIMVLTLCLGATARALPEPVAGYCFDGNLDDCSGNGYYGQWCSLIGSYSSDVPPGFGGQSLCLDGTQCVELPLGADNPLDFSADCSIVMWFKVPSLPAGTGALLFSSARDNTPDNHALALFLEDNGNLCIDMFWVATVSGTTEGLDDDTWHHVAVVHVESSDTTTIYLDGAVEASNSDIDDTIPNIADDTVLIGDTLNTEFPAEDGVEPLIGCVDDVGIYDQALTQPEVAEVMTEGPCPCAPPYCPFFAFDIDPNVMTVYEEGETIGDFDVSLRCEPTGVVTVTVDPNNGNGPNDDLTLIGGSGPQNRITLTFDPNNWDVPQTVVFQAIDDDLKEGPDIDENHEILLTTACANPNWDGRQKGLMVTVMDNDQPDIIFTPAPPLQVYEYAFCSFWYLGVCYNWTFYPRTVAVSLQVPPKDGGLVKVTMGMDTMGINNPPTTDPVIWTDPNILVFSSDGQPWNGIPTRQFDNPFPITVLGTDDSVLQAEGASAEGEQNYTANLEFSVVESGVGQPYDPRYGDYVEGEWEGMEKTFQINIEDNECGAYGISHLDVGNPDPNAVDEDGNPLPDCYIDIYDVVEIAAGWLRCTNPQDENCESAL